MKTLETLADEYKHLLDEMKRKTNIVKSLPPQELKDRKLVWTGIVGAIQDSIDSSKFNKICNTVICEGTTCIDMFNYLTQTAKDFVEIQKQVQEQLTPNDTAYYGNIDTYSAVARDLHSALCSYSNSVSLSNSVEGNKSLSGVILDGMLTELEKLDLRPEDKQDFANRHALNDEKSGCFSVMILLIVSSLFLTCGLGYGLVKLFA